MIHDRTLKAAPDGEWMPAEQPLEMPSQDLARRPAASRAPSPDAWMHGLMRAGIFGATLLLTAAFAWQLYNVLAFVRLTPIQGLFLVLSTLAFGWVALGSVTAVAGGLILGASTGSSPYRLAAPHLLDNRLRGNPPLGSRIALLFPVYHEAPDAISGNIEAMMREVALLGAARQIDVFILSDSRTGEAAEREQRAFATLTQRLAATCHVYYRRRRENTGRKAGNIAEWVRRHGDGYDCFVILDADSVMTGTLLVRLARTMEQTPRAGLIQTVPRLIGGHTLFQQLQQFAASVYGPAITTGIAAWQGKRGNYWGHNAIIRTRAFAEAAGLPHLPGQPPFGGAIMSHDFVEAALMQRAGWDVTMVPMESGSYEGTPPTIVEHVIRDRRWAQGNLQHLAVVRRATLTRLGRLHLLMGAASYIVSAIWAASIMVGIVLALQGQHLVPSYFRDAKTLFPIWPVIDPGAAQRLLAATMCVVMLPKIVGLLMEAGRDGGPRASRIGGIFLETFTSILLAPMLMVTQTCALVEILLGRDAGWNAQRRAGDRLSLWSALVLARWQSLIGSAVAVFSLAVSLDLALWMSPIILGLILAGPLLWATSRPPSPLAARFLATDENDCPPALLADAQAAARHYSLTAYPPTAG